MNSSQTQSLPMTSNTTEQALSSPLPKHHHHQRERCYSTNSQTTNLSNNTKSKASFVRGSFVSSSFSHKTQAYNLNNRSRCFRETNYSKYLNDSSELQHSQQATQSNTIKIDLDKQIYSSCSSINESSTAVLINQFQSKQLTNKSANNGDTAKLANTSLNNNKTNELFLLPPRPTYASSSSSCSYSRLNKISPSSKSTTSHTSSMDNLRSIAASSGIGSGSMSSLLSPSCSSLSPRCTSPSKSQMPFKIRSSKYRHVYGAPHKEDVCYKNIKITKNAAHDSAFCAINPKFVAIVTEECGGGAFIVIPVRQTGRVDTNMPKVTGHRGPVLDLKWNPFNDNEIASCSEDTTIKVWQIDDDGLHENLNQWIVDLHGHQRRVTQIEWHPTAENIMISCGADFQVLVWNLEKAEPIRIINCHNDTIQSMNWNRNGSLFATTCKDKKIRIIDPRSGTVVHEFDGHQGSKTSKVIMLGCGQKLFTTGFSKLSERQIALWDMKDLSKPLQMELVDPSSGALIPYYDYESKIVYVAGKGDGNIRYYEITDSEPYIHYLSEYKSSAPQRGLGFMPKRGLDVTKNEIFRFYKLHATGNICEPISMIVPRKAEVFQEDIYPDTPGGIPSMSCDEWIAGENREPILVSMKDGAVAFMPKIITYKQLGFSELNRPFNGSNSLLANRKNEKFLLQSTSNSNSQLNKFNNAPRNSIVNNPLMPFVESQSKTLFNTNSRSAFNKVNQLSSSSSSPPSSPKYFNSNESNQNSNSSAATITATNDSDTGNDNDNSQSDNFPANNKKSELETSYVTNLSKNPVTLRKTESLKLESVQNIRNRFNRVSSHHLGTLTRNHSHRQSDITTKVDLNNSSENLKNGEENDLPPPPNLVQSPIISYKTGPPTTPTPLILSSSVSLSSSSSTSSNSNSNNTAYNNLQNGCSNTNGIINGGCSEFISYGVKKRVWTPISSNGLANKANDNVTASNFSELQKSYFRILDEKNSLKEQISILESKNKQLEEELSARDKRIESLENRVNKFLTESLKIPSTTTNEGADISDC